MHGVLNGTIDSTRMLGGTINSNNTVNGSITSRANVEGSIEDSLSVDGAISNSLYRGLSAYEIALKYGFVGSEEEWLASHNFIKVDVVVDTEYEYILKFTNRDKEYTTPNLIAYVQPIPIADIHAMIKEVSNNE